VKAWRVHRDGEPVEVMELDDIPEPPVGPCELLVEVEAVGLMFPDLLLTRGQYQITHERPSVAGNELVGTVVAAGTGATLAPGTRVSGTCRPGRGALADRTILVEDDVMVVPPQVPPDVAVTLPTNYVTAYLALHTRAQVRPGEVVLVHGGAGGVGSAAIDVALAAGARVIATDIGAERTEFCTDLGAHLACDTGEGPVIDAVLQFSGGAGADVVIDPVGGDLFDQSRRCIAFCGRIVVVGYTSGTIPVFKVNNLVLRNFTVMGVNAMLYLFEHNEIHRRVRQAVVDLCVAGRLHPKIHAVFPYEEAPYAIQQLGERGILGKAVVRVR
jgi:NADPH2:quinone reductase